MGLYAKSVISGNTIDMVGDVRAQTLREYLEAVNTLFALRGYPQPTNFAIKSQPPALFYENAKTWESEPCRRTHITPLFLSELLAQARRDAMGLGLTTEMADWVTLGRYTGF